jgi:hypothetical protein
MQIYSIRIGHSDGDARFITQLDPSTFPNNDNTNQVRADELASDILSWKLPVRPGSSIPITVRAISLFSRSRVMLMWLATSPPLSHW